MCGPGVVEPPRFARGKIGSRKGLNKRTPPAGAVGAWGSYGGEGEEVDPLPPPPVSRSKNQTRQGPPPFATTRPPAQRGARTGRTGPGLGAASSGEPFPAYSEETVGHGLEITCHKRVGCAKHGIWLPRRAPPLPAPPTYPAECQDARRPRRILEREGEGERKRGGTERVGAINSCRRNRPSSSRWRVFFLH